MTKSKAKKLLKDTKAKIRGVVGRDLYSDPEVLRIGEKIARLCDRRADLLAKLHDKMMLRVRPLAMKERRLLGIIVGGDRKRKVNREFNDVAYGAALEKLQEKERTERTEL